MTISSKPKQKSVNVDALINKGGSVAAKEAVEAESGAAKVSLQLRIPADALAQVDALIKRRKVKPSRNNWLLEAIFEKLEREETQ